MKRKMLLSMAAGVMILTACNKDDLGGTFLSNQTISATLADESPQTRTALNGLQVVWSTYDEISVFAENGESVSNNVGTIKTGFGTTSATFDVILEGTTKIAAAYPYAEGTTYADGKIQMTLPETYSYTENGIGGAPMAARINNNTSVIAFKNAGALMGLTVNNIPAGYNKAILTSKGDEAITGACEITFDNEGKPTMKATTDATGKTITINFDAAQTVSNKTFYFPIPVANYSSLELSISNGTDTKTLKTKGLNAERSMRYKTTLTLDVISGETPVEVTGAINATQKLAEGNNSVNVTITEEETDPTISLPANANPTSLSFESIPADKTVTIQATPEDANVSDNVNISASSDEDSNNSFVINLPNSTVTLDANGESATYDDVTASTAEETLIINQNVTVTTLKIKRGHVRVHGKIGSISREGNENGEVTYIIKEDGAEIPESITDENIKVVSAAEWDLHKAVEVGGEYTLTSDIQLSLPIIVEKDLTVNLNNHNLTGGVYAESNGTISEGTTDSYVFWVKGGTLTINGEGNVTASKAKYSMAVWANGGEVVINGGNYYNSYASDLIYAKGSGSEVSIYGGTFTASNEGAESEEGTAEEYSALNLSDNSGAKITVYGGKFYKFDPANNKSENPAISFVATGYSSVAEGDYYVVSEGIKNETALAAAVAAGGDVTLDNDITLTLPIIVEKDLTVNLNNHNLTGGVYAESNGTISEGTTDSYVFWVKGGTLTIKGEGDVTASEAKYSMAVWANGGKVVINGGNYYNSYASDLIYAKGSGSEVSIYGGTFTASNKDAESEEGTAEEYSALNLSDNSGAKITVYGGKFYKFDPANNKSENPAISFVAEGYTSQAETIDGATWYSVIASTNN